jgi:DNA-binding response OmpR family regulator
MAERKPRVLVVEDDASMRSLLRLRLGREGYDVRAEADGTTLEEVAQRFRPDLAILDVNLAAGPDGYHVARQLRSARNVSILFVTGADSIEARLDGFDAGADDYVVKPFEVDELAARVRALLRRAGRLSSAVWEVGDVVVDPGAATAARSGQALDLTATEYQLLLALLHRPGEVLTKAKLLKELRGRRLHDVNVVEVHMSSLRRKLEAHGPRILHTVRGAGYVLRA